MGRGRMGSPAEGGEAAVPLSSEARPCHKGSVRIPFPGELPLDYRGK